MLRTTDHVLAEMRDTKDRLKAVNEAESKGLTRKRQREKCGRGLVGRNTEP